jgi:cellulose synthase/poly-beta-1,6-N-acetylglucosamine synthase-like glycosyltransferase
VSELAKILFWVLVGTTVVQGLMVCRYFWALWHWKSRGSGPRDSPKAVAILCVRGNDPVLEACLAALLNQDYPSYDVRVVVDSRTDPAWEVVQAAVAREGSATRVQVEPLTRRRDTCSRKIAGVLQALAGLDEGYEVVALLDSDTIPHRTWLGELVAPLADPRCGAASGNRWYMPVRTSWADLARSLWNAAAVVQMYWYGIPWGGSTAFKRDLLRRTDLLERLAGAFGEDSTLSRTIRRYGYRVAFVPAGMIVNRDTCRMGGLCRFLQRQLLTVRMHNPWWWAVVAHGLLTSLWLVAVLAVFVAALLTANRQAAGWSGASAVAYPGVSLLLLAPMEIAVRRIVAARGEPTRWLGAAGLLKLPLAIPITQVVYGAVLLVTMFTRTHRWRNVLYRFGRNPPVQVVEDCPSQTAAALE